MLGFIQHQEKKKLHKKQLPLGLRLGKHTVSYSSVDTLLTRAISMILLHLTQSQHLYYI